jgi:hypothetical protein
VTAFVGFKPYFAPDIPLNIAPYMENIVSVKQGLHLS